MSDDKIITSSVTKLFGCLEGIFEEGQKYQWNIHVWILLVITLKVI